MAIVEQTAEDKKEFLERYGWFDPYDLLEYLSNTTEESWCMDVVKNNKGQSCFFGHVFDWGGGDSNIKRANDAMNLFEAAYATEYMVYPVNDGRATRYPQSSPKQRCLAYFRDLLDGKEKTTIELMNE